jgi:hypothetical protein
MEGGGTQASQHNRELWPGTACYQRASQQRQPS